MLSGEQQKESGEQGEVEAFRFVVVSVLFTRWLG